MRIALPKLLVLSVVLAAVAAASAQSAHWGSCPVIVEALDVKTGRPVARAMAKAVHRGNDEQFTATTRAGGPYFRKLEGYSHMFAVTAPGYKSTSSVKMVYCDEGVAGKAVVTVYMWKGRPSETIRMDDAAFATPPYRGKYGVKVPIATVTRTDRYTVMGSDEKTTAADPPMYAASETASSSVKPTPVVSDQAPVSSSSPQSTPKRISGGVLNAKATSLPKPVYPPAAKAVKAAGNVVVQVMIDEEGNVISAEAVSGHPLLKASAIAAARSAKFSRTLLAGQSVKVTGVVVYSFDR